MNRLMYTIQSTSDNFTLTVKDNISRISKSMQKKTHKILL